MKISDITLERLQEIREFKRRVFVDKPLIGLDVAHRESPTGYGREWEMRGFIEAATLNALNEKKSQYIDLADGRRKVLDLEDGSGKCATFILDPEIREVAGYPLSREYVLRVLEAPPIVKKFMITPTVTITLTCDPPVLRTIYGKVFSDLFDSETTGGDPSNWSVYEGANCAVTIDDAVYQGASGKSVKLYDPDAATFCGIIGDLGESLADPVCEFYMRQSVNTKSNFLYVKDSGALNAARLELVSDGNIKYIDSASAAQTLQAYAADTWYLFRLENFNFTADTYDIYIDNVLKKSGADMNNHAAINIRDLRFYTYAAETGYSFWVDTVKVYRGKTIVMTNLPNGAKFRIRKSGPTVVATSGAASGGSASIALSTLSDRPPYYDLQVALNGTDFNITSTLYQNDIWGGAEFIYLG